jgi:hypothetical protein
MSFGLLHTAVRSVAEFTVVNQPAVAITQAVTVGYAKTKDSTTNECYNEQFYQ